MRLRVRMTACTVSIAVIVSMVASLTAASPAGAALQPFTLAMTSGELRVRAAQDPLALETPTTITGQHDTGEGGAGAVTGGDLSTPPISFQTVASGLDVYVTAAFSSVTPGAGTGVIDAEGNVTFRTDVRVDLDLRIGNPNATPIRCTSSPVRLDLGSLARWDPTSRQVTVRDADFTIPAAADSGQCTGPILSGLNTALAGAGNSLTLTLVGDLVLPPAPGCPTITELEPVDPASSFQGDAVTMAATVIPDPAGSGTAECEEAEGVDPTGTVEFRSGDDVVGVGDLDVSGRAEVSTSILPIGDRPLTARYRALAPYEASVSSPVAHQVAARPQIVAEVPPSFLIGGPAEEFDVTVTNTSLGVDLANARLDLAIAGDFSPVEVVIEWFDGADWVASPIGPTGVASLMAPTGVPLGTGTEVTQRVRVQALASARPAVITTDFRIVPVDQSTGEPDPATDPTPIARTSVPSAFVRSGREPVDMSLLNLYPHTARQGMVVTALVEIPVPAPLVATGTIRMFLDGQAVPIRSALTPVPAGFLPSVPVDGLVSTVEFALPPDAPTGTREVTVEYSGDRFFDSDSVTSTVTVLPKRGVVYECGVAGLFADRFRANVSASGILPPAVTAGASTAVRQLDVRVLTDRGDTAGNFGSYFSESNPVLPPDSTDDGFDAPSFGFGDLGTGTATEVTFANNTMMDDSTRPVDPSPDQVIGFTGETASIVVDGAPGDVVPIDLATVGLRASVFGGFVEYDIQCTPVGQPVSLGDVIVAGTTLAIESPDPTREGDPVTLTATVAPTGVAGTVEFRDGTNVIGVAPVGSDGTASLTTRSLPIGSRSLVATFRGGSYTLPSAAVVLEVRPRAECPTFTAEGNGRVVRLVYLTLLRRCPDQAGYDYWTDRLDGGTSREVFANDISGSLEAMKVLVDDAYQIVLDRPAEPGGADYWARRLQKGERYDRLLANLASSPEFSGGSAATNTGFVTRLYERLLRSAPDPGGLDYWVHRLASGAPRSQVALAFSPLPAIRARLITDAHQRTLDRDPTASELSVASPALAATGNLAHVYRRIIATTEFVTRANNLANP